MNCSLSDLLAKCDARQKASVLAQLGQSTAITPQDVQTPSPSLIVRSTPSCKAVKNRQMNKTEAEYSRLLEIDKKEGKIIGWWYEAVTVRLGHDCRYTPDFFVRHNDGVFEFIETKGSHVFEDSQVKFRVACESFPFFRWTWAQKKDGQWRISRHWPSPS